MIEVRDLTKKYGPHLAIDHLNFTVNKGEVIGFLGPNGAGKTTTMKIITGYMAPTTGSVRVAGFDVFENPIEVKKRIGYLPETPPVYLDMFVTEYLDYVARLKSVPKQKITEMVNRALEKTNLIEVRKRLIKNLSKGFRQRVGIAQALVSDPEILILDEPTVGLDPKQVAEIRHLILDLKKSHTIVLSTHILPEVQASCERIIIINKGKIIAEDSLQGLAKRVTGGRRVYIKVRRNSPNFMNSISSIQGVHKVESADGNGAIHVDAEEAEDLLEKLSNFVVGQGVGLLEMRSTSNNLEDIFLKLTGSDNTTGGRSQ